MESPSLSPARPSTTVPTGDGTEHHLKGSAADAAGGSIKVRKKYDASTRRKGAIYSRNGLVDKIKGLLLIGASGREIQRKTRAHSITVSKILKIMEAECGHKIMCPCGNHVRHQGWCAFRYEKSDERKAFIAKWPDKKTIDQATKIMDDARVSA